MKNETNSGTEDSLIQFRKDKAKKIRAEGCNPFDNRIRTKHSLKEIRLMYGAMLVPGTEDRYNPDLITSNDSVAIAGRIIFKRDIGGATFIRLRDYSGDLQIYCEQQHLKDRYSYLENLDLGDFVEAVGPMMATIKGELSVRATNIHLLTKAYRPLPIKTHLKDVELRYRQRYVDLIANPDSAQVFKARSVIIRQLRTSLDSCDFLEVETPTMHSVLGGASAKPFTTHHNALDMDLYLRVAPELYLKRLVVGGFERVYEIGRLFRNEGLSTKHNPEFTSLEFYQAYSNYMALMDFTEALLKDVDYSLQTRMKQDWDRWSATRPFTLNEFARMPMTSAINYACGESGIAFNVMNQIASEDPDIKGWAKAAKAKGREIDWTNYRKAALKCNGLGELIFCAFEYLAEPFLTRDYRTEDNSKSVPVFIHDYPVDVSPLARRIDGTENLVARFELFIDGKELCNAFDELNDPEDQAQRFKNQAAKKEAGDDEAMMYDEDYIRALEYGMPPTAGFGMGVDRLVMLLTNSPSIKDVILFPQMRKE